VMKAIESSSWKAKETMMHKDFDERQSHRSATELC